MVTIVSHNFALRSRFSNEVSLFQLNCIDDVAASTAFQIGRTRDAIPFRRHESINLALMTFSGRTVETGMEIGRFSVSSLPGASENRGCDSPSGRHSQNSRMSRATLTCTAGLPGLLQISHPTGLVLRRARGSAGFVCPACTIPILDSRPFEFRDPRAIPRLDSDVPLQRVVIRPHLRRAFFRPQPITSPA